MNGRDVYNRENPVVVIKNLSTVVTDAQIRGLLKGLQSQVTRDFAPVWGLSCSLIAFGPDVPVMRNAMSILVKDVSDDPGALGYHWNPEGWPTTEVFAKDDMAGGAGIDGLSVTISHEILEMLADPGVNLYALGPAMVRGKRRTVSYPYEVCDAVQGNTYISEGVRVSDFVFPEWFEAERAPIAMNYAGGLRAPFTISNGGYASFRYGGRWYDVWGPARTKQPSRHRERVRDAEIIKLSEKKGPEAREA